MVHPAHKGISVHPPWWIAEGRSFLALSPPLSLVCTYPRHPIIQVRDSKWPGGNGSSACGQPYSPSRSSSSSLFSSYIGMPCISLRYRRRRTVSTDLSHAKSQRGY